MQRLGVGAVHVCGIGTDQRVRATGVEAARLGVETTVLLDLTAAVDPGRVRQVTDELTLAGVRIRRAAG